MNKPKYHTIIVTDFELRMLESLPEYKLETDGPQWKASYVLKRILKRNKLSDDEPAVTTDVEKREEKTAFETFNEDPENLKKIREINARLNDWIDKTRETGSPAPWPWDANGNPIDEEEPKP